MPRYLAALALVLAAARPSPRPSSPAAAAATTSPAPDPAHVVARVGDDALTREVFEAFWQSLPASRRQGYEQQGGERAFLDDLVDQKLIAAEAVRQGYLQRPQVKAAADFARDNVLYHALLEEQVTRKVLSDEALRAWYDAHPDRFRAEEMVRARHILVTPFKEKRLSNTTGDDATSEAAAEAKVQRLKAELDRGADFAELARESSEDTTAAGGGLLPDFPRGRMAKPFEDVAFALEPGHYSDGVRTPYGWHLIRVEARIPAHVRPFEEVRDQVARAVADENRDRFAALLKDLTKALRAKARIEVDEAAFPAAPPRATPGAPPDAAPAGSPAPAPSPASRTAP